MKYRLTYTVDEQGLNDAIGLELVTLKPVSSDDERQVYKVYPFKLKGHEGNNYTYEAVIEPEESGTFRSCVRMYPKNPNLPHRQDFCYVKWLS